MLRYADAKVVAQTLSELFSEGFGIAPDVKINAIIVRGDASQLKEVEAIVKLVDGENGKKPAVVGRIPRFKTSMTQSNDIPASTPDSEPIPDAAVSKASPTRIGMMQTPGFKFIMLGVIAAMLLIPTLLVWAIVMERDGRSR